jgi:hypothetical protein
MMIGSKLIAMLDLGYDYATCVRNSEKVSWKLDEVLPPDTKLDFSRPFLPAALSGDSRIAILNDHEKLKLNQITGNSYMNLFGFVEEYIIAQTVDHAQAEMYGDHMAIRALLRFAEEECKHQHLFHRYCGLFAESFGSECKVLDNAAEVAAVVLSKSPLAVMTVTLHLEIMTQAHYTESVRDNDKIDPLFSSLLKYHWLEEAQHARIDALELDKLVSTATPEMITQLFDHYLELGGAIDGLLDAQANMDVDSLSKATGRTFSESERATIHKAQHAAYRQTFLVAGMVNRQFANILEKISPEGAKRVAEVAAALS